ncbi:hypothetical protein QJS10_CPB04g01667 [Acorus calamus]|uniref:Uncharacterized protein n=1 Tax=Acorus calamus TaxID=4465 RepID=A0AAV9EZU9_ACOCL|nr:hypothetical protein QJS10_CPB04g01667 [Acorus calamus]
MSHILRIRRGQSTWKYLGIPIPIARAERRGAIKLKETILDRLQVWKAQLLSKAGRFSLIRSVLQALPLHLANSASLSVTTAQQVEMLTPYPYITILAVTRTRPAYSERLAKASVKHIGLLLKQHTSSVAVKLPEVTN